MSHGMFNEKLILYRLRQKWKKTKWSLITLITHIKREQNAKQNKKPKSIQWNRHGKWNCLTVADEEKKKHIHTHERMERIELLVFGLLKYMYTIDKKANNGKLKTITTERTTPTNSMAKGEREATTTQKKESPMSYQRAARSI